MEKIVCPKCGRDDQLCLQFEYIYQCCTTPIDANCNLLSNKLSFWGDYSLFPVGIYCKKCEYDIMFGDEFEKFIKRNAIKIDIDKLDKFVEEDSEKAISFP